MADVYVNALTTLTGEPASTDSAVMVNRSTNEGKIIDYNLLADKVLEKLRTKTFSEGTNGLTTTSKILCGAINELDGDISSLNGRLETEVKLYNKSGTQVASNPNIYDLGIIEDSGIWVIFITLQATGASDLCSVYTIRRYNDVFYKQSTIHEATASNGTIINSNGNISLVNSDITTSMMFRILTMKIM